NANALIGDFGKKLSRVRAQPRFERERMRFGNGSSFRTYASFECRSFGAMDVSLSLFVESIAGVCQPKHDRWIPHDSKTKMRHSSSSGSSGRAQQLNPRLAAREIYADSSD